MPAVKPLSPIAIRDLLIAKGYEIVALDDYNWAFAPKDDAQAEPVIVPHKVALVPLEVAFHVARKVGFDDYFDALPATGEPFPPDPLDGIPPRVN